jgi:hypothetical protein
MSDEELLEILDITDLDTILYELKNQDLKKNADLIMYVLGKLIAQNALGKMPERDEWIRMQYRLVKLLRSLDA